MVRDSFKKTYHWVLCSSPYTNSPLPSSITFSTTKFRQDNSPNATMVLCIRPEEANNNNKSKEKTSSTSRAIPSPFQFFGRSKSMVLRESPNSLCNSSKHVVIVMDALKEFSIEPLQWGLDHVIDTGYTVTLLGVMPWLNLPLSSKTWLDVWRYDLDDLPALRQRSEWIMDVKYQKVREIMELCDRYGVVPHMKVLMGYPSRLLVVEQTQYLHATCVVFDRYHRKNRSYYSKKIHCNVVMMNSEGEMDIIKTRTKMNDGGEATPSESPALPPIVSVTMSENLKSILRPIREQSNEDEITEISQNTETTQNAETSRNVSLRKASSQARKVQWLVL